MKIVRTVRLCRLPVLAIMTGLFLFAPGAIAESARLHDDLTLQPEPALPIEDPASAAETKMFTGVILSAGDRFVLSGSDGKTTYQLDDQMKAQEFVNKNVKVTGVLAATGVIRVNMIVPA